MFRHLLRRDKQGNTRHPQLHAQVNTWWEKENAYPLQLAMGKLNFGALYALLDSAADLTLLPHHGLSLLVHLKSHALESHFPDEFPFPGHGSQREIQESLLQLAVHISDHLDDLGLTVRCTALHFASMYGFVDIVRTLVDRGADIWAESANQLWPVDVAVSEAIMRPEAQERHREHFRRRRKEIAMFLLNEMIRSHKSVGTADLSEEQATTLALVRRVRDLVEPQQLHVQFGDRDNAILENGDLLMIEETIYRYASVAHSIRTGEMDTGIIGGSPSSEDNAQEAAPLELDDYLFPYDSAMIFLSGSTTTQEQVSTV